MPKWKRAPDDDTTYYYLDDDENILGYVCKMARGKFHANITGEKGYTVHISKARATQYVEDRLRAD